MTMTAAKRSVRKRMVKGVKSGQVPLRVTGSQKSGFRLAAQHGDEIIPLGHTFAKQSEAVSHGEIQFGQKAKKLVAKSEALVAS